MKQERVITVRISRDFQKFIKIAAHEHQCSMNKLLIDTLTKALGYKEPEEVLNEERN